MILWGLPLIPAGDHGIIVVSSSAAMRDRKKERFEYGMCDESVHPGTVAQQAVLHQLGGHVLALQPCQKAPD
jgi:hypothetical protein